jgi:hypothetical protein
MPIFIALNHRNDKKQVNITMSPEAQRGTWYREESSTATLDFERGEFIQSRHGGTEDSDRQLRGRNNELMLVLKDFVANTKTGRATFAIEDGVGSFGAEEAFWTRLEG